MNLHIELDIALIRWVKSHIRAQHNTTIMLDYGFDVFGMCSEMMCELDKNKSLVDSFKNFEDTPKELKKFWIAEEAYHKNICSCMISSSKRKCKTSNCEKIQEEYWKSKNALISYVVQKDLDKQLEKNFKNNPEGFVFSYHIHFFLKDVMKKIKNYLNK